MKAQIFIMEDNEFYFKMIKEILEKMSLTFYPNSLDEFDGLRRLLCTCTDDSCLDSVVKESRDEIFQILKDNTDKETTFLVTCCLGESQDPTLEGLEFYKMFTKDHGRETIIISDSMLSKELERIKSFCEKNPNCFLFRKSKETIRRDLGEILMEVRSDIFTSQPPVKLLKVLRKGERSILF